MCEGKKDEGETVIIVITISEKLSLINLTNAVCEPDPES